MADFVVNSDGPVGGNLRASLRKQADNTMWTEGTTSWDAPAGGGFVFTNSSQVMTETAGLRGAYEVNEFTFTSTFSGKVLLAIHDVDSTNDILHQVLLTSRGGLIVEDVVIGLDRSNYSVHESLTFPLSRRQDGTVSAVRQMTIEPSESALPFALDTSGLFDENINVSSVDTITLSAAGELAVSAVGTQGRLAILSIDGGQVSGETYELTVALTMTNSAVITGRLLINTRAT